MQRTHKYNAVKTMVDGHTFDSKAEAARYSELRLMERVGVISNLELQPSFELQPPFRDAQKRLHRAIVYVADFAYDEDGRRIVEDVKGGTATQTPEFRIKWKLAIRQYPNHEFRKVTK
jgi:hypothetical protein